MKLVDKNNKYLGALTAFSCNKMEASNALKDHVCKKVNEWKEKLLLSVGKEVILNWVIQAMSNYISWAYLGNQPFRFFTYKVCLQDFMGLAEGKMQLHWKV